MRLEPPPASFASVSEWIPSDTIRWRDPKFLQLAAEYRPWHKHRHIARQRGFDPVESWQAVKRHRLPQMHWFLELVREEGWRFCISDAKQFLEPLHRIDRATGGGGPAALSGRGSLADESLQQRFRIRTLMDEAAESSIIEGAATTRRDAVKLLRAGRPPQNKHERMVVNNYLAMQQMKLQLDRPLDLDAIFKLHRVLTTGTLTTEQECGRFRRADEPVRVENTQDNSEIFCPPTADRVPALMQAAIDFANREHASENFVHPIVKASILHFLIGYIHPFVDGNGRTARALFYWFALRHGYSVFEFLSISEIISKGWARYPQAFVDVETDDGDLTYFVQYQLDVIEQSLDRLAERLAHEEEKIRRSEAVLKVAKDLNLRQRLLLEHALRHPLTEYTVKSHAISNGTTLVTARSDLSRLVKLKLLATAKRGKEVVYLATPRLIQRLAAKPRH